MERLIEWGTRLPNAPVVDRRGSTRFPLRLEVNYTLLSYPGSLATGSGTTIDISSSGVSFTADKPLAVGQRLRVGIDWPAQLHGGVQLQLVVDGVVVRTAGAVTAVQMERHEFRTRRVGLKVLQHQGSLV